MIACLTCDVPHYMVRSVLEMTLNAIAVGNDLDNISNTFTTFGE